MFNRRNLLRSAAGIPALAVSSAQAAHRSGPGAQPNFIHICTDDMRFDDYTYMKHLRNLVRSQGTVFENHFVPYSVCAPSRASILTGLQVHNHGVLGNHKPYGYYRFRELEDNALAVWLANAGYAVSHIGKFINGYKEHAGLHIPPGYADWHAFGPNSDPYYGFTLNDNGTYVKYDSSKYSTDVFVDKAVDFITTSQQPFAIFLWVSCPHYPVTPAIRDAGTFDNIELPIRESFNEADMSDKPRVMQKLPLLTDKDIKGIQRIWRRRQETLQSLDRGIAKIVDALTSSQKIDNTHIILTSDNGDMEGEHRVDDHKNLCYDEAARTPLYWRQPGGVSQHMFAPVVSMDATAAMLELAGATPGRVLDGRSLVPLLSGVTDGWNTAVLSDCAKASSVATQRYRYVEWGGEGIELYDMDNDPAQMESVAGKPEYAEIQASLAEALHALQVCAGPSCSWTGPFKHPPGL